MGGELGIEYVNSTFFEDPSKDTSGGSYWL